MVMVFHLHQLLLLLLLQYLLLFRKSNQKQKQQQIIRILLKRSSYSKVNRINMVDQMVVVADLCRTMIFPLLAGFFQTKMVIINGYQSDNCDAFIGSSCYLNLYGTIILLMVSIIIIIIIVMLLLISSYHIIHSLI